MARTTSTITPTTTPTIIGVLSSLFCVDVLPAELLLLFDFASPLLWSSVAPAALPDPDPDPAPTFPLLPASGMKVVGVNVGATGCRVGGTTGAKVGHKVGTKEDRNTTIGFGVGNCALELPLLPPAVVGVVAVGVEPAFAFGFEFGLPEAEGGDHLGTSVGEPAMTKEDTVGTRVGKGEGTAGSGPQ